MDENSGSTGVMTHITKLNAREHQLYEKADLTEEDIKELHQVKAELDQYWDLLHQRRGFQDADEDPDKARLRSKGTIERYKE